MNLKLLERRCRKFFAKISRYLGDLPIMKIAQYFILILFTMPTHTLVAATGSPKGTYSWTLPLWTGGLRLSTFVEGICFHYLGCLSLYFSSVLLCLGMTVENQSTRRKNELLRGVRLMHILNHYHKTYCFHFHMCINKVKYIGRVVVYLNMSLSRPLFRLF